MLWGGDGIYRSYLIRQQQSKLPKHVAPSSLWETLIFLSLIDVLVGYTLVKSRWPSSLVFSWLGNLSLSRTKKGMKVVECLAPAVPRFFHQQVMVLCKSGKDVFIR